MRQVRELVSRFGPTDHPVLVRGESGTGKELVAQALHALSDRSGPFVAANCGAIPTTLVESELFGTEKGAFTDSRSRAGLFERANGGTLFLDEIAEMPPQAQTKLLRVLEDRTLNRVGATAQTKIDVRVISATNREEDLREDLYYRLSVLTIETPPLRSRPEDIPLLAGHFLAEESCGRSLSGGAVEKLCEHTWPGNVRELRNTITRAIVMTEGEEIGADAILCGRPAIGS
jgi:transcriptional regulator with PAS, ATPase and Fis domain